MSTDNPARVRAATAAAAVEDVFGVAGAAIAEAESALRQRISLAVDRAVARG